MKIVFLSFYLFIAISFLSFYLNIVCKNIVCELGLNFVLSVLFPSTFAFELAHTKPYFCFLFALNSFCKFIPLFFPLLLLSLLIAL